MRNDVRMLQYRVKWNKTIKIFGCYTKYIGSTKIYKISRILWYHTIVVDEINGEIILNLL